MGKRLTLIEAHAAARDAAQARGFSGPNGWYEGYYDALNGSKLNPYRADSVAHGLYESGHAEGVAVTPAGGRD